MLGRGEHGAEHDPPTFSVAAMVNHSYAVGMGWSEYGDGILDGDGPSDAVGEGMSWIADEAMRRTGKLPTSSRVLHSLVQALNLDGSNAPFYCGTSHIAALVANHGAKRVRIDGKRAEPWIVAELYAVLEVLAEEYQLAWQRPPTLAEVLHYFGRSCAYEEIMVEHFADTVLWDFARAKFRFQKGKTKPADRAPPPKRTPKPVRASVTLRHSKFGEGVLINDEGERLRVRFGDDVRVVLRGFVTMLDRP